MHGAPRIFWRSLVIRSNSIPPGIRQAWFDRPGPSQRPRALYSQRRLRHSQREAPGVVPRIAQVSRPHQRRVGSAGRGAGLIEIGGGEGGGE